MHDIRTIRQNPTAFDAGLAKRGLVAMSTLILALDEARRTKILASEIAQAAQNAASKEVGAAKAAGNDVEFERLRALVAEKKAEIGRLIDEASAKDAELRAALETIPNIPDASVPMGADEKDNQEVSRWGTPATFDFPPKEHFEIAGPQKGFDFTTAGKISGSRFVVLKAAITRLHRALGQFMLDTHVTEHDLTEVWTPVLVKEEAMYGTGQLPKFAEDSYQTTNGWWLVPTAEVTLTNMVAGEVVDEAALPLRLTAHTQCFRSEAGSAGRDTTGMLRQHQFEKVEMVTICTPEKGLFEHERMTRCAEVILEKLALPYRRMLLCSGDMGFGATKTHDLEVWLPGQNTYREISSVSVCGTFQARRMNARYRGVGKPEYLCTLNGSGLAVGRTMIAVLENGQKADGSVNLPDALYPYLSGKTMITAAGDLA
ncbi:MAG: serine--tRNA ligase [Proteobacteria bacterium]|nr:serine--tRNA ligase [Pseudomonadota bacterium]